MKLKKLIATLTCFAIFFVLNTEKIQAQIFGHGAEISSPKYEAHLLNNLNYRSVGPYRGGRSVAVTGHDSQPYTFYTGYAGGGVFKTTDGGNTWDNVTDKYFKTASVGAITVAPSDPNVIYVGMGETDIRGNMSGGDGMYKSTDAGKTWTYLGLGESQFIGDIEVHPTNEDIVWVEIQKEVFSKVLMAEKTGKKFYTVIIKLAP